MNKMIRLPACDMDIILYDCIKLQISSGQVQGLLKKIYTAIQHNGNTL